MSESTNRNHAAGVSTLFSELNKKANLVYKFVTLYSDYMTEIHDYGTGQLINMVEVHTLTAIEENPNITITQLANEWNRTTSALSQTVKKLEQKGLITRQKDPENARNILLNVTPEGYRLSIAHKQYDTLDVTQTMLDLSKSCTDEEVDGFFRVLEAYIKLLEPDQQ